MKKLTSAELTGTPPGVGGAVLWTGVDVTKFSYSWSADAKTLSCSYLGGFSKDSPVAWMLNPSSATVKFEGTNGIALPSETSKGVFFTTGPESGCFLGALPGTWGNYSLNKFFNYLQRSAADPIPQTNGSAFAFTASAQGSSTSAVTAVSITFPDATQSNLFVFNGTASAYLPATNRDTLNTKFPAGSYTMRFTQTGQPERVVPMTMPADSGAVPKILNYDEAQMVNPSADFTLRWNEFLNTSPSNYVSVVLFDSLGRIVFRAPNLCVPRLLAPTDTSVVVPANLLQTNFTYNGILQFGNQFYFDTNSFPSMTGSGNFAVLTSFILKTTGGALTIQAPTLNNYQLLPNGDPQFQISGTVTQIYAVERAPVVLPLSWNEIGSVTIQAGGNATFEDTSPSKTFPLFYRAVAR